MISQALIIKLIIINSILQPIPQVEIEIIMVCTNGCSAQNTGITNNRRFLS